VIHQGRETVPSQPTKFFAIMPELLWIDDIPMPNMAEEDYQETEYKDYEDSDWWNDPNCVMSRHHY
jgi:hypothetical protein